MRATGITLVSHGSHEVAPSAVTICQMVPGSICWIVPLRNASRVIIEMLAVVGIEKPIDVESFLESILQILSY